MAHDANPLVVKPQDSRTPEFCIIGAQKAGTSTLWRVLSQHPEIFMPKKKELNFFFDDAEFKQGLTYYERFFDDAEDGQVCGEASPGYICHPRVPLRLKRLLKNPKLILILRDPIQRAYSQYWDNRRWLREKHQFDDLVAQPLHQVFRPGKPNYFSRGLYSLYLERYLKLFHREQILVLWFDELRSNPTSVFRQCFDFLGVSADFPLDTLTQPVNFRFFFDNPLYLYFFSRPSLAAYLPPGTRKMMRFGRQTAYKPEPISERTHAKLMEYYAPFDGKLTEILGVAPPWSRPD
jgi:hypothetical protein